MAEFPMLPLWTDAYLADTVHLSTIEHGAYLLLLMAMWRTKAKRLPNDDKLLARFARLTPGQWQRIKPSVMPFFVDHGGEISQSRLTDEANAVRRNSARQSDKAKTRWLNNKETPDAAAKPEPCRNDASLPISTTTEEDSESDTNSLSHPPDSQNDSDFRSPAAIESEREPELELTTDDAPIQRPKPRKPDKADFEQCFEERFWPLCPRKAGKAEAKAKFVKKAQIHSAKVIVAAMREHGAAWEAAGIEKRFIPHPATWLNGERYLEEPDIPQSDNGRSPANDYAVAQYA